MDTTPQGMGNMGLGMQGIGSIMSVIGAFASASSNQSLLRGQADIADINAETSRMAARTALQVGEREQQQSMISTSNLKAKQTTGFAAGGVDLGVGSAARVRTSTDVLGEIDKNTIAANALRNAWGYRTQATNFSNEAIGKRAQAGSISPGMAAFSTLLTGAGNVASSWYQLNKGAPDVSGHEAYWKS